jgi:hypothetical protein
MPKKHLSGYLVAAGGPSKALSFLSSFHSTRFPLWFRLARVREHEIMNRIIINADLGQQTISRHIYGHFSEHLGRCIYGGYWVGEESSTPNTRGIRNDVVQALRATNIPNLR